MCFIRAWVCEYVHCNVSHCRHLCLSFVRGRGRVGSRVAHLWGICWRRKTSDYTSLTDTRAHTRLHIYIYISLHYLRVRVVCNRKGWDASESPHTPSLPQHKIRTPSRCRTLNLNPPPLHINIHRCFRALVSQHPPNVPFSPTCTQNTKSCVYVRCA